MEGGDGMVGGNGGRYRKGGIDGCGVVWMEQSPSNLYLSPSEH